MLTLLYIFQLPADGNVVVASCRLSQWELEELVVGSFGNLASYMQRGTWGEGMII